MKYNGSSPTRSFSGGPAGLHNLPRCVDIYDQMSADLSDSRPKIEAALDKLIANGMPFATVATTSTAPPTAAALQALKKLLDDVPPEPLGEWMRQQGFPPETSLLVLPESMRDQAGPFPPRYVRFSPWVDAPTMVRDLLGHLRSLGVWSGGQP